MYYNHYVYEKLADLENQRTARRPWQPRPGGRPVLAELMRSAGSTLRHLGELLESRAAVPEGNQRERRPA